MASVCRPAGLEDSENMIKEPLCFIILAYAPERFSKISEYQNQFCVRHPPAFSAGNGAAKVLYGFTVIAVTQRLAPEPFQILNLDILTPDRYARRNSQNEYQEKAPPISVRKPCML
jgi:hypothetical protein